MIDTGVVKARTHHPTTGLDVLRVEKVSKAQAWQRTGRAGREAAGKCYRNYTKEEFERMKEMPVPEIQRCSLAGVALQLLAIGVDITTFDFMDKPPKEAIDVAVTCLEKLGAVKGESRSFNDGKIIDLRANCSLVGRVFYICDVSLPCIFPYG